MPRFIGLNNIFYYDEDDNSNVFENELKMIQEEIEDDIIHLSIRWLIH